ncbi:putative carboxylesterase protein [Neofusicoccum parvum UCRNP2]|uniref:Carboxylic ester hydrolase n=1 Tax=Botryosphaeria parva (strain UCR-NP2) TaxID=1287680 RepID=R1EN00_BOTPV|nr:putative carboxylesterase protein [Neofusicoccum parvum UCRNP2]
MAFRFLGVPFAQPPVGDLRFKHAEPWHGAYVEATKYSAACVQSGWYDGNSYGLNPWGNSEDCLYLNVYTPEIPDSSANVSAPLKPVLFWMHGGGQVTGTGIDSTFDGASLVSRSDVVLVTINYRLNIFGYLALDDDAVLGNFATSDMIVALEWVKKYISGFGGDPNKVTIFGQSAGGYSVIDLITSPKAEGLFDGAIIQSGGKSRANTAADAAAAILPYIEPYCNSSGVERLECLQQLPADTLLNLTTQGGSWGSVIDNDYTLDVPIAQVSKGRQSINQVKLMMGFMPEEGQSLLQTTLAPNVSSFSEALDILIDAGSVSQEEAGAIVDSGLWLVGNGAASNGSNGSVVYTDAYNASVKVFTDLTLTCAGSQFASVGAAVSAFESMWVYSLERGYGLNYYNWYGLCSFPVGEPDTPYYRCHSGDLYEVFGTYYLFDQPIRVPEDIYFTNAIQDIWASFARTGNPNVNKEYLEARGYNSTLSLFSDWDWPEFDIYNPQVASLQYPGPSYTTLPDQQHCKVLMPLAS